MFLDVDSNSSFFFTHVNTNFQAINAFGETDPMDMSDGMQEAMHRSHLEMRYKWVHMCLLSVFCFLYNTNSVCACTSKPVT